MSKARYISLFSKDKTIRYKLTLLPKQSQKSLQKLISESAKRLILMDDKFESGNCYGIENNPIKLGNLYFIASFEMAIFDIDHIDVDVTKLEQVDKETTDKLDIENRSKNLQLLN